MPCIAQLTAPEKIQIQDSPSLMAGPGETIIQAKHAGACGTDLSLFNGNYPVPLPQCLRTRVHWHRQTDRARKE
jgi:threonine dehydrogenase-like Zn-dependent dehydrogenase